LIVFHSREEDVDRPTSPQPIVHDGNILSCVDLLAGGVAAVGMNIDSGRFAILTNCRYKPGLDACGLSRGTLIRNILKGRTPLDQTYQGLFHLYYGNVFVPSCGIEYVTNVGGFLQTTNIPFDSSIIVRMNEHPSTEIFWNKKYILEVALRNAICDLKIFDSPDQVIEWLTQVLSRAQYELNELPEPSPRDYGWSQFPPDSEKISQSRIVIPPFQINDIWFGTVSQTCIIAEEGRAMYYYRNLVHPNNPHAQFIGDWLHREILSPSYF
jgi:hypothetical protein